jgi:hypothetical protein
MLQHASGLTDIWHLDRLIYASGWTRSVLETNQAASLWDSLIERWPTYLARSFEESRFPYSIAKLKIPTALYSPCLVAYFSTTCAQVGPTSALSALRYDWRPCMYILAMWLYFQLMRAVVQPSVFADLYHRTAAIYSSLRPRLSWY